MTSQCCRLEPEITSELLTPCLQHKPEKLYSSVEVIGLRNMSLMSELMSETVFDSCCTNRVERATAEERHLYGLNALLELEFCLLQLLVMFDVDRLS